MFWSFQFESRASNVRYTASIRSVFQELTIDSSFFFVPKRRVSDVPNGATWMRKLTRTITKRISRSTMRGARRIPELFACNFSIAQPRFTNNQQIRFNRATRDSWCACAARLQRLAFRKKGNKKDTYPVYRRSLLYRYDNGSIGLWRTRHRKVETKVTSITFLYGWSTILRNNSCVSSMPSIFSMQANTVA